MQRLPSEYIVTLNIDNSGSDYSSSKTLTAPATLSIGTLSLLSSESFNDSCIRLLDSKYNVDLHLASNVLSRDWAIPDKFSAGSSGTSIYNEITKEISFIEDPTGISADISW